KKAPEALRLRRSRAITAITAIFSLLKFFHHELLHQRHRKRTFIERRIVEALEIKLCPQGFLVAIAEINPLVKADEISNQLAGAELGPQQFSLRFRLRLETLLLHKIKRFLITHIHRLQLDVKNRIDDHAQPDLEDHENKARIMVGVARIFHL